MSNGSISLDVRYFAILREQCGIDKEKRVTNAMTARELYSQVAEEYGFSLPADKVGVAINNAFCPLDHALKDGDQIVFIPPVGG